MTWAWVRRLDAPMLAGTAGVCALGLMTLFSASREEFASQLAGMAMGAAVLAAAAAFDYRRLAGLGPWLYAGALLMLVLVRVAGHSALGAQRWIRVAGVQMEPSEVAKLLVLLVLAAYLARRQRVGSREMLVCAALGLPPFLLVLTQPDLGTSIVFAALLLGMLFLAGAPRLHLAGIVAGIVAAVPLAPHFLHGYQRQRLEIFLDPGRDPLGAGYNLLQARIAVGAGGMFGSGWLHGAQGRLGYVPERTSDFAFAMFAEQFGLAGCAVLLGLFALVIFRVARAAAGAGDRFGELLCGGVAVVLATQVVQNMGMNIGLTPIAGIPLPLVSHGRTSVLVVMTMLGLVQSVLLRRPRSERGGGRLPALRFSPGGR